MLTQIVEGVLVHESDFAQSNAVVVQGEAGVLLIDVGIRDDEMVGIGNDLRANADSVAAGFSTHPHWDHLLWHAGLGTAPRYGTARCAAAIEARLLDPNWHAFVTGMIAPEIVQQVTLDELFGRIIGLPAEAGWIPWDGPRVRILEHQGHAPGHAALLIEERRVLVAGDMLSDVLIPMLNFMAEDPIGDYLAALQLLETVVDDVDIVIPGHGSVGGAGELRARIDQDRAYLQTLRDGTEPVDPRVGPSAKPGWEWVADVHDGQVQRFVDGGERDG
ncbi:MBL fold metallo-hydrolase [soil metagenome]